MPRSLLILTAATALLFSPAAGAQDTAQGGSIAVELNKLEAAGADCQATVVATNGATKLDSLKLDLVVFDGDGIVAKRLAAELGPLAAKKTVVKTFSVKGLACPAMSRVVLNDVIACEGPSGPVAGCIDRIALGSRTAVAFGK